MKQQLGRTLVIGAGSGRDLATAVLVREELRDVLGPVQMAGFLTPWAIHDFEGRLETPVVPIEGRARKYSPLDTGRDISGFFEPELPRMAGDLELGIEKFWLFSLQYGSTALRRDVTELLVSQRIDTVIAVDVGGDIIAQDHDLQTVLTPIVDFSCLGLLEAVKDRVRTIVAVVDPGICGEVRAGSLRSTISEFDALGAMLDVRLIRSGTTPFQATVELNRRIDAIGASSHTAGVLADLALSPPVAETRRTYVKTYRFRERCWSADFEVSLGADLVNRIFLMDGPAVTARLGRPFHYDSVLDAFLQMREETCGTEVDCSAIPVAIGAADVPALFLVTPCCYFNGELRRRLIREASLLALDSGALGLILMREDLEAASESCGHLEAQPLSSRLVFLGRHRQAVHTLRRFLGASRPGGQSPGAEGASRCSG